MKEDKLREELNNAEDTSNVIVKWKQDPKGYFTIKPFRDFKKVFVRYYDAKNNLKKTFLGIATEQIAHKIIENKLISRLEHAAYLGKEFEKAIIALKNNIEYVQDEELKLKKI